MLVDLTETNPTSVGFDWDPILVDASAYEPDPRGRREARETIARAEGLEAERLILTASTSEAYGWLFKLLCDPGDEVLVPEPSYPLFPYLARLEGIGTRGYSLVEDAGWQPGEIVVGERSRAIVVVNPGSPTGTYVEDWGRLRETGLPLIVDEVFARERRAPDVDFRLGGLSKRAGLPQIKLAWIAVRDDQALRALELVADSYLSVSAAAMLAAPRLLGLGRGDAIEARVSANRGWLRARVQGTAMSVVSGDAGWWAVLRVPAHLDEETLVLRLLDEGVLVHPGYFFDFPPGRSRLVVSLIVPPETLAHGVDAMCAILGQ